MSSILKTNSSFWKVINDPRILDFSWYNLHSSTSVVKVRMYWRCEAIIGFENNCCKSKRDIRAFQPWLLPRFIAGRLEFASRGEQRASASCLTNTNAVSLEKLSGTTRAEGKRSGKNPYFFHVQRASFYVLLGTITVKPEDASRFLH